MNVSPAASSGAVLDQVNLSLLRKTLDMAANQNAQMLKSLPQVQGPGHLGRGVDLYM